ncbi:hypothetical protein V8E51_003050 [Hyaloscypha variabilis]
MRPGCVLKTSTTEKVVINIDVSDDDEASQSSFSVTPKRAFEGGNEGPFSFKRHKPIVITTPTRPTGQRFKHEGDMSGSRSIPRSFGFNKIKPDLFSQGLAGVPEYVNLKVRQSFAPTEVHPWKEPLSTFIRHTFKLIRGVLLFTLYDVLHTYEHTGLSRNAKETLEEFLRTRSRFYMTEMGDLFTVNEGDFLRYKAEALEVLNNTYVESNFRNRESEVEDALERFKETVADEQLDLETDWEVAVYIQGYSIACDSLIPAMTIGATRAAPSSQHAQREPIAEEGRAKTQSLELIGQKDKILVDATSELRNSGLDHVVKISEFIPYCGAK